MKARRACVENNHLESTSPFKGCWFQTHLPAPPYDAQGDDDDDPFNRSVNGGGGGGGGGGFFSNRSAFSSVQDKRSTSRMSHTASPAPLSPLGGNRRGSTHGSAGGLGVPFSKQGGVQKTVGLGADCAI